MKFQTQALVTGVKFFTGKVEGTDYDSSTIFCLQDLDESNKTAKGQAGVDYKCGTSALYRKMQDWAFPVNCVLTLEQTTTGKVIKTTVVDVQQVTTSQPTQQKQA